jgi:hypothetical protein
VGEGGGRCPLKRYAPRSAAEQAAWNATRGAGAWRYDWVDAPDKPAGTKRRVPQGLLVGEALARCGTAYDPEDLIGLLEAIEAGEIAGAASGWDASFDHDDETETGET